MLGATESDPPENQQDDDDQQHQAEAAGGVVAPAGAVGPGWQGTEQQQDENDKQNGTHVTNPPHMTMRWQRSRPAEGCAW